MKKKKSFFKRQMIAIAFVVIVAIYAITNTVMKEIKLQDLKSDGEMYIDKIKDLENQLKVEQKRFDKIDSLEFIEAMARERFKMVRPDEIYLQMTYDEDIEEDN